MIFLGLVVVAEGLSWRALRLALQGVEASVSSLKCHLSCKRSFILAFYEVERKSRDLS
uniref:Uncharacterized protein n=1 Tax=Solanum tuberosum TaxID=4113 RepID=M1BNA3_SOLTU